MQRLELELEQGVEGESGILLRIHIFSRLVYFKHKSNFILDLFIYHVEIHIQSREVTDYLEPCTYNPFSVQSMEE